MVRNPEYIFLLIPRDDVMDILRIEIAEHFHGHSGQVAYLLEMQHPPDMERVHMCRHRHRRRSNSMFLIIPERIHRTDESGNIATSLPWKEIVHGPEVLAASASFDGLVDISSTAIVG